MSYSWAKVYIEILDDHKMGLLPDHLWRRVIEFILLAKKLDQGGFLPGMMEMSWILRISTEQLEAELLEIQSKTKTDADPGIVHLVDGNWFLTNFAKRQALESDAERARNYRKRSVTQDRHEPVTNRDIDLRLDLRQDKTRQDIGANAPASSPEPQNKTTKGNARKPKTPKLPRDRDAIFDAIAEVCCVDPATAGSSIGNVKVALLKAKPPYSADEVRAFGKWHDSDEFRRKKGPPSLWQLKEKIGIVRNGNGKGTINATHPADYRGEYTADDYAAAERINAARAAKRLPV